MQDDIKLTGQRVAPQGRGAEGLSTPDSTPDSPSNSASDSADVFDRHDEALERVRWELATMAGRLRAAEAERDAVQRQHDSLLRDRDRARETIRTMRGSESYRFGRAVVSFVKNPVKTSPRLVRGAIRRLRPTRADNSTPSGTPRARPIPPPPPVHLYVAIGLEPEALHTLVRTVSQHALVNADPQPIVVTDSPTFALLRNLGVVLEYLPDRVTWEAHRDDVRWDDLLADRLARLLRDHSAIRTVVVNRRTPQSLPQLLALDATT